jgi:hypothetical protein
MENCKKCGQRYLRDFRTRSAQKVKDHATGRTCKKNKCGGQLYDTIINFGESLPQAALDASDAAVEKADLCLAMGSSLTVTPAADYPKQVAKAGGALVICNIQATPLDKYAKVLVHAKCDDFMQMLMDELKLPIPSWRLVRYVDMRGELDGPNKKQVKLRVHGSDSDNLPASLFRQLILKINAKTWKKEQKQAFLEEEEFTVPIWDVKKDETTLLVGFMGHYNEPDLLLSLRNYIADQATLEEGKWRAKLKLSYNPQDGQWLAQDTAQDAEKADKGIQAEEEEKDEGEDDDVEM